MTTYLSPLTSTWNASSTANFRATGSLIDTALSSIGISKTADAGQIDWATVNAASASTYAGYEIRAFSDTLQATFPIVFKLEYGTSGTGSQINLRVSVGHATDGAGTLTGWVPLTATAITASSTTPVTSGTFAACFNDGSFWMSYQTNVSGVSSFFSIDRRRNQSTGSAANGGDYRITYSTNTGTAATNLFVTRATGVARSHTTAASSNVVWSGYGSGYTNGDATVSNVYGCFPEIELMDSILLHRASELAQYSTLSSTVIVPKTYLVTGYNLDSSATNCYHVGVWQ